MWVQAVGTVSAVLAGFALNASNRRRDEIEKLAFAIDALNLISWHLERVNGLIETRDANGTPLIAAPESVDTAELREIIGLIRRVALTPLSSAAAIDLLRALRAAEAYADALDRQAQDVHDSLKKTFEIFAVDQPMTAVRNAAQSLQAKVESTKAAPLLGFK